jgi:ubiquinone/menaquinone biosynthesis C-methylase UbiE
VAAFISLGHWNNWAKEIIPFIHGTNVLELGFGPGHLQVEMIRRGLHVYGVDESSQMLRRASRLIRNKQLPVTLIRGLAQQLPFQTYFDSVIATFPSEYIFNPGTVKEIYRVLVPGGKLVILLTAMPGNQNPLTKIFDRVSLLRYHSKSPVETRLNEFIQTYEKEGFRIRKTYLERKIVTLLLLVGEKPIEGN